MTSSKKIVLIATSADKLKPGSPTGLWLEELATPYYQWKDARFTLTIASIKGGETPVDPISVEGDEPPPPAMLFCLPGSYSVPCSFS